MLTLMMYFLEIGGTLLVHVLVILMLLALTAIILCCGITLIIALGWVLLAVTILLLMIHYMYGNIVTTNCSNQTTKVEAADIEV